MAAEFYAVRDAATMHLVGVSDAWPAALAVARGYGGHCFVDRIRAGVVRASDSADNIFEVGPDGAEYLHDRGFPLPGRPRAGRPAAGRGETRLSALVQRARAALAGDATTLAFYEVWAPDAESPAASLGLLAAEVEALAGAADEMGYHTKIGGALTVTHWRAA